MQMCSVGDIVNYVWVDRPDGDLGRPPFFVGCPASHPYVWAQDLASRKQLCTDRSRHDFVIRTIGTAPFCEASVADVPPDFTLLTKWRGGYLWQQSDKWPNVQNTCLSGHKLIIYRYVDAKYYLAIINILKAL